jgi:predicted PhzF superfamily epimerase YddE/YHI9
MQTYGGHNSIIPFHAPLGANVNDRFKARFGQPEIGKREGRVTGNAMAACYDLDRRKAAERYEAYGSICTEQDKAFCFRCA